MGNAARKAVMNCKMPVRKQAPRAPAESVAQPGAPSIASGKGAESCAVPCATSPSTGSLRPESATWSVFLQDWQARRRHLDRDHNRPLSPEWDGNLWQLFDPNSNRRTFRHAPRSAFSLLGSETFSANTSAREERRVMEPRRCSNPSARNMSRNGPCASTILNSTLAAANSS
jgi:hypothetical protein